MVICTVEVNEKSPQTIVIGRRGTYNTQEVVFDIGYLIDAYGVGTAVLAVKRSQDSSAHPAVVAQEDSTVTWTVSETDTYYKGAGECELMWYVDGGLAKTIIYPMVVMRDILSTTEEAPDAYQTWVDDLTALGAETLENAQNAAQSASDAESAKDDAVTAKEAAEEAAETAQEAVVHAPIIQNGYWHIWNDGQYVDTGVRAEGQKGDKGDTGEKGDTGNGISKIEKTGTSGLVDTYTVTYTDGTSTTFTVTNGAKGDKGDTGATGNGIQSITKTGTSGNVDTYTITYTNGQTTTFTVTNGAVSSVAGKTGAVTLDANDVAFSESGTYDDGTVGKELSDQKNALNDIDNGLNNRVITVNSWTSGKYIKKDGSIETISANTVAITDVIDIHNCAQISVKATEWAYGGAWDFAFYAADGTYISGNKYYDPGVDVNNIVIPANAYYFRAATLNNDADFSGDYVSLTYYKRIADIEALVRQQIIIGAGNYSLVDGLKLAKSMGNCDVYILPGEYNISSQIATLHADASTKYGLPLGWNNRYYFEPGSKVVANYTGSDSAVKDDFAPFSADLDGSNFLLSGLWLECDSLRYCIHDEGGGKPGNVYCHEYKNCHIVGTNLTYNACIGGGLGYRAEIVVDGCYFSGAGSATGNYPSDVFYHGNYDASIADDSISRLYVKNNYFEHLFAITYLGHAGEEIYCFYSGNSASGNISYEAGHADVIAYNNIVR